MLRFGHLYEALFEWLHAMKWVSVNVQYAQVRLYLEMMSVCKYYHGQLLSFFRTGRG